MKDTISHLVGFNSVKKAARGKVEYLWDLCLERWHGGSNGSDVVGMQVCTTIKIVHTLCFVCTLIAFCACAQGVITSSWKPFSKSRDECKLLKTFRKETHLMSLGENREKPAVARIEPSRDTWLERSVLYHWTTTSWQPPASICTEVATYTHIEDCGASAYWQALYHCNKQFGGGWWLSSCHASMPRYLS